MPQTTFYTCDKLTSPDDDQYQGTDCKKPVNDNFQVSVAVGNNGSGSTYEGRYCGAAHMKYNLMRVTTELAGVANEADLSIGVDPEVE